MVSKVKSTRQINHPAINVIEANMAMEINLKKLLQDIFSIEIEKYKIYIMVWKVIFKQYSTNIDHQGNHNMQNLLRLLWRLVTFMFQIKTSLRL